MPTRRRGHILEAAVLAATWTELAEHGYQALTIGAVAERAGTSKAVIYRRWRDRADLVTAALRERLPGPAEIPDTGTLRDDLYALLTMIANRQPDNDTIWGLLAETARSPGRLSEVHRLLSVVEEHGPITALLRRALHRQEIDRMPPPRIVSLPIDLMRNELLITGRIPDEAIAAVIDDIVLPLIGSKKPSRR